MVAASTPVRPRREGTYHGPYLGRAKSGLGLSKRELEVARLVTRGLANRQIAARLGISPKTVEAHLFHAVTALDVWDGCSARPTTAVRLLCSVVALYDQNGLAEAAALLEEARRLQEEMA